MSLFYVLLLSPSFAADPSTEAAPASGVPLATTEEPSGDLAFLEQVLATVSGEEREALITTRMQSAGQSADRWADVLTILRGAGADADPNLLRVLCLIALTGTDEQRKAAINRAVHLVPEAVEPKEQGRVCFFRMGRFFGSADRIQIYEVDDSSDLSAPGGNRSERRVLDTSESDSGFLELGNSRRACFSASVGKHVYEGVSVLPKAAPLLLPIGTLITNPKLMKGQVEVTVVADQASYVSTRIKMGGPTGVPAFTLITEAYGPNEFNTLRDERPEYRFVHCVKPDGSPLP